MTHALLCGFNLDFLVQLGPASGENGRLIALEYDGLGLSRTKSLEQKVIRYGEISAYGIEPRWLTSSDEDAVRTVINGYEPPHFVWVRATCPVCGHVETRYLIDPSGAAESPVEIEEHCDGACKKIARY